MAKKKIKDPEVDQKPSDAELKAPEVIADLEVDQKSSSQESDFQEHPKFSKFKKEKG